MALKLPIKNKIILSTKLRLSILILREHQTLFDTNFQRRFKWEDKL